MAEHVILITGASGGIGAALARAFAREGVTLLLWGRNQARLDETARQCRAKGAQCRLEILDLRDLEEQTGRLAIADRTTPIDVAIFNAGLGGTVPDGSVAESAEAAGAVALVDFVAPVVGANLMASAMASRGHGRIVLIGSIAESYPLPMAPTYAGAKAGLRLFAEALGLRLKKQGVTVTLVSPGFIDTAMSRQVSGPKPFLMNADDAARIIARGIEAGRRTIVLPWQFAAMRAFSNLLPRPLLHFILSRS
jgi:short-subunit dehydrogenase